MRTDLRTKRSNNGYWRRNALRSSALHLLRWQWPCSPGLSMRLRSKGEWPITLK
jgi:hypothetical protein